MGAKELEQNHRLLREIERKWEADVERDPLLGWVTIRCDLSAVNRRTGDRTLFVQINDRFDLSKPAQSVTVLIGYADVSLGLRRILDGYSIRDIWDCKFRRGKS